jgi:mono/diheme cytochrome c family protein
LREQLFRLPEERAMSRRQHVTVKVAAGLVLALVGVTAPSPVALEAQEVTFNRDIVPILQQSCQSCHRAGGVGPMPLETYQQVRRYASRVKERTGIRDRAGAMPPWYVEKDIGIQHYKYDPSLSDEEIAAIATWVDAGTPEGDPADLPAALVWNDDIFWSAGEPDLIVETEEIVMAAGAPDWWGEIASVPIPLDEDRYVSSVEIREVNDIDPTDTGRQTVGGRYIFHHMIWGTRTEAVEGAEAERTGWPVHEVGRNPDIFDLEAGRLLHANSSVVSNSIHLHSSGRDTRGKLLIGFRFHPVGYEPRYPGASVALGNAIDIDILANTSGQELHSYEVLEANTKFVTFEPHLHAPGERMCIEAIWGFNVETLSCVGYDHNWVRGYAFEDGYQPLLPKGTVVHTIGYMNNTTTNTNVPDPRNWAGSGNRSVSNMFIDLGMQVAMNDEEFLAEMQERVERFDLTKNDHVIGCPLCLHSIPVPSPVLEDGQAQASAVREQ